MIDVLQGQNRIERKVLDKGFVALIDVMPRLISEGETADSAILEAARNSYGKGTTARSSDRNLLRYLMRNQHSSPLEMCEIKFHVKAPIFVARQTVRHRTFSINEVSARYSIVEDEFYIPHEVRLQSQDNKQGSEGIAAKDLSEQFHQYMKKAVSIYEDYNALVQNGVAREIARIGLPINQYTQWYWKVDLKNLLHFLRLRMDPHAQEETRKYANAIYDLVSPIFPMTMEAFNDYQKGAVTITKPIMRKIIGKNEANLTKREVAEFRQQTENCIKDLSDSKEKVTEYTENFLSKVME